MLVNVQHLYINNRTIEKLAVAAAIPGLDLEPEIAVLAQKRFVGVQDARFHTQEENVCN